MGTILKGLALGGVAVRKQYYSWEKVLAEHLEEFIMML